MGDPTLADESKIPDFAYLKNPEWHGRPDYLHYDANYLLIADNLADFNHIAYVHTNTLVALSATRWNTSRVRSKSARMDSG